MPIFEIYKQHQDLVIVGKIESGTIELGDILKVSPNGHIAQALVIYDENWKKVKAAAKGEFVRIVAGVSEGPCPVHAGDVLCRMEDDVPVTDHFEAEVLVLDFADASSIFSVGFRGILHIHTYTGEVKITHIFDKTTHSVLKYARCGSKVICRIKSRKAIALDKFSKESQKLGSFCIRDGSATVCVGHVLRYKPYKWQNQAQPELKKMKKQTQPPKSIVSEQDHSSAWNDSRLVQGQELLELDDDYLYDMVNDRIIPKNEYEEQKIEDKFEDIDKEEY